MQYAYIFFATFQNIYFFFSFQKPLIMAQSIVNCKLYLHGDGLKDILNLTIVEKIL